MLEIGLDYKTVLNLLSASMLMGGGLGQRLESSLKRVGIGRVQNANFCHLLKCPYGQSFF